MCDYSLIHELKLGDWLDDQGLGKSKVGKLVMKVSGGEVCG